MPRPGLCTDNGAMVAALGAQLVAHGAPPSSLDIPADSALAITGRPGVTLMWEVRAADGRLDELVAWVVAHAGASASIYRSDDGEPRVVVIDPTGAGLPDPPPSLVVRPPHVWPFTPVER